MPQKPRLFTNQQERKAFFLERERRQAAEHNSNPYMSSPWQQIPSQPASQAWSSMQATPQPTPYFPQPYMSQEQRMQEYYRFEQELAKSSFERFQSMISQTGQPAYSQPFNPMSSPFPPPQDPPPPQPQDLPTQPQHPPTQSQHPYTQFQYPSTQFQYPPTQFQYPPTQSQHPYTQSRYPPTQFQYPSTQSQHPAHATQYQFTPGLYVPHHPHWSGSNNQVDRVMEEYILLQSRQAVSPDTVVNPDEIWFQEIEDEECNNEEHKLKRKASAEKVDKLKKPKLDQVGNMNVKTRDRYQADKGTNHGTSNVQDSSKYRDSAKVSVPEPQKNASATIGSSKYGSLDVQEPSEGRDPADTSVTELPDNTNARNDSGSITTPFMNPPSKPLSQQPTTRASSAISKSRSSSLGSSINTPASLKSSVDGDVTVRRNREAAKRIILTRLVEDAKNKLDHPTWKAMGSLSDDFAYVTKGLLDQLKSPTWYSVQLILVWRASLSIPSNWIVLVQDEVLSRHPISDDITDIVQIYMEESRRHFTTTHLSLKQWTMVYYNCELWKCDEYTNDIQMFRSCDRLVKEVRHEFSGLGFETPDIDPLMSAEYTIKQCDDHSCGPFTLREVEILLGYHIDRDLQCPLAIRSRHARTISKAITNRIDRIGRSPFSERDHNASDLEEIDNTKFVLESAVATSSAHIPETPVMTTRSSPELEFSIPHPNLELTAPLPGLEDVDEPQDQEERLIHLKGTRGMPSELVSTLKVAQEKPKPRPRPQYHGFYCMPLPGNEDGDVSTVPEYESEESDQFIGTGNHDVE